jgi:hypothetical protein
MSYHLFTIENDAVGQDIVKRLRKQTKKSNPSHCIRLFARGPGARGFRTGFVNTKTARQIAVYLTEKPKPPTDTLVRVVDLDAPNGERLIRQPTKYHPDFKATKVLRREVVVGRISV